MKESDIQKVIMDYLAAKGIFAIRMNSGAMFGSHKGKRWAVRFGLKGMADILAFPYMDCDPGHCLRRAIWPTWIEVKNEKREQTPEQEVFASIVEREGHRYILARSLDVVIAAGL